MIEKLFTKFQTVKSAINWYLLNFPVRQKSQSIEPNGGCKPTFKDFDKDHPQCIHASLTNGFHRVYKTLNALEQIAYRFEFYHYPERAALSDVADYHSVSNAMLVRARHYVLDAIEDELVDRGLMPLPDNWEPAQRNDIPISHKPGKQKSDAIAKEQAKALIRLHRNEY